MNYHVLKDKTVLVTGGTGSFGSNFVKHILKHSKVKKVIVFSRDELKQSRMNGEIKDPRVRFFLGDVRDLPRLMRAFDGVDIVVHAAALKQVPTLEYNPFEAVKTNILGSQNVVDAAIDKKVKKVLLISTDKAAEPVNLYGSTKLCAEKLFVSGNSYTAGKTLLSCVRYGNVIGSRGSIIETLLKNKGADTVHVTHEDMTRFWINLDQAFTLVLFTLSNMNGGEIVVPKLPSMSLKDLFDTLAPHAKRIKIGIRPGEKMHEVLLTKEEARHAVTIEDYFVIIPEDGGVFETKDRFEKLLEKAKPLPHDFHYTSDTTALRFTKGQFQSMLGTLQ